MNIFDLSFVNITKIINAEKLLYKSGHSSACKEWRNKYDGNESGYCSLSFTMSGEAEYRFSKCTLTPQKNCIMFLDNYTPFNYKITNDHSFYTINFVASGGFLKRPNMYVPKDPEKFRILFQEASAHYKTKKPGYILMTTSILMKILALIKEEDSQNANLHAKSEKMIYITDHIQANISNPMLSVESIATHLGISGTHLRNLFLKKLGTSPIKYIKELRIKEAQKYLMTSALTVKEICEKCGFYDTSYFCKEFKKTMGCTPYQYKKLYC